MINHQPSVCPYQSTCNYLLSIYNPDSYGPITVSLRLQAPLVKQTELRMFQEVQAAQIDFNRYQFYSVEFTVRQLDMLNFTKIRVIVWSTSGRVDIFVSTTERNPRYGTSEAWSATLNRLNNIDYDVSNIADLSNFKLYIGLYGA